MPSATRALAQYFLNVEFGADREHRAARLWAEFLEQAEGLRRERDDVLRTLTRVVQQPMAPVQLFPLEISQHTASDTHVRAQLRLDADGLTQMGRKEREELPPLLRR